VNSTGNSKPVSSNQSGIHKDLDAIIRKHGAHEDRTPIPTFVEDSLDLITQKHREAARPLWLDSFCGTGMSTRLLASANPDHLIIGVDQSTHRLTAEPLTEGDNFLLVRSDCESLWRLMARQKIKLAHHTLFYPNPWPKSAH
jgi:tRNA (guanine-N7-)-methyltransferase